MVVGIHTDPHKGFTKMLKRYETILDFNSIGHIRLDLSKPDFWEKVKKVDLFIFHYYGTERQIMMAQTILPVIADVLGISCYPNPQMSWLYDDKVREYYFLSQHDLPVIPTWIFWDKTEAVNWLREAKLPVVFKLGGGAASVNVVLVKNKLYARRLINKMFGTGIISGHLPGFGSLKWRNLFTREHLRRFGGKVKRRIKGEQGNPFEQRHRNYILFQQFLPNNNVDTRIHIYGNRAFGDMRFVRPKDFRASGSGRCTFEPEKIDRRCIKIAFDISKRFGFYSMAFDFLYNEQNQPLISEMSYTQPDDGVRMYPGFWDDQLNWHEGHFWPQYMILQDRLNLQNLKQPEMGSDIDPLWLPHNKQA